jgi:Protein of unknown function (DUF992)
MSGSVNVSRNPRLGWLARTAGFLAFWLILAGLDPALVGGSRRSTVLQPVSLIGQVGVNLALGVAGLTLRFAGS